MNEHPRNGESLGILGYGEAPLPSLSAIGGESAVLSSVDKPGLVDIFTAAAVSCASWAEVTDRVGMKTWLCSALTKLDAEELLDLNDIALASREALPEVAAELASAWKIISSDSSLRGSVAIEGWTRLAVGGWTAAIPLRGALYERAQNAAAGNADADIFLVRSLGAALDQWSDDELEQALELLASFEHLQCDVAFELGMVSLRKAVCACDIAEAVAMLAAARRRFESACLEGDRPDAVAFAASCGEVARFLGGEPVREEAVSVIESSSREWFLGYLGEVPHWRQPRAETAGAWTLLVRDLFKLRDIDSPAWYEPARLLADVGRVLCAHNSSALLANPGEIAGAPSESQVGTPLPVALGPRLERALGADESRIYLVERWLSGVAKRIGDDDTLDGDDVAAAAAAVEAALSRIRGDASQVKPSASRESGGSDPNLREALRSVVDHAEYDHIVRIAKQSNYISLRDIRGLGPGAGRYTPLDEELLLESQLRKYRELMPVEFARWQQHLCLLLTLLIRIVKDTLNREQGGTRRYPWHRVGEGKKAHESVLADHLAAIIGASTGFPTDVEVSNRAGGRADVVITFDDAERFVIEVKRILDPATDHELSDAFGDQAGQYTLTGPPFAFLGVLDLNHWDSRLPASGSFWIHPWRVPTTGEVRVLTGFRVLGDVATPSDLSR
ncbi:hypothetical protein [Mycolicibacterium mucogenicum]|uniref:Uncharacterized protein n=1 Tax=Mycolicibacterium mucogenicum DSM 44124 TaxID=1226753 RepID=A0A8E4W3J7_MYCMU|nr:hypothetical protein [Mycolicibacterium mucogenicum]QPG70156.1 hypothetical protein C1S78_003825 [Mycolicibacterium mucogenicum DSM 44124]